MDGYQGELTRKMLYSIIRSSIGSRTREGGQCRPKELPVTMCAFIYIFTDTAALSIGEHWRILNRSEEILILCI